MSAASNPSKVVCISDPGPTLNQISTALEAQNDLILADVLENPERLIQDLTEIETEIILIAPQLGGQSTLDIIDNLVSQFPDTSIVAILPDNDPVSAQQVMLAGAQAFLIQPFTQANLLSTLRRVSDLHARRRQAHPQAAVSEADRALAPINVLAVYSPRGGVGSTTVATNLAIALQEETGDRVLLMEGKLFFGHLDVMLNIRTHNSLADLIPHASTLDETLVRDVVYQHISGIYVLLAPREIQAAQGIRPQDLFAVVTNLRRYFDTIIIDAGSHLSENTVTLLDAADKIVLVTSPDLVALHDVSRFTRISQSLAYPAEKVLLVMNRADRPGGIKTRDLKQVLHTGIFSKIPDDSINAMRSLNKGVPLMINAPRSQVSRSYKSMAKLFIELDQGKLVVRPSATPSERS